MFDWVPSPQSTKIVELTEEQQVLKARLAKCHKELLKLRQLYVPEQSKDEVLSKIMRIQQEIAEKRQALLTVKKEIRQEIRGPELLALNRRETALAHALRELKNKLYKYKVIERSFDFNSIDAKPPNMINIYNHWARDDPKTLQWFMAFLKSGTDQKWADAVQGGVNEKRAKMILKAFGVQIAFGRIKQPPYREELLNLTTITDESACEALRLENDELRKHLSNMQRMLDGLKGPDVPERDDTEASPLPPPLPPREEEEESPPPLPAREESPSPPLPEEPEEQASPPPPPPPATNLQKTLAERRNPPPPSETSSGFNTTLVDRLKSRRRDVVGEEDETDQWSE